MNLKFKRVLAAVVCVCLCISALPFSALAYDSTFISETHDVFSRETSTIAPGVTQDIVFAYAKDGKQMAYYVATADINRDDVIVQTSYKDQYVNKEFGMAKLTEHIAFADSLYTDKTSDRYISDYYKVVAGVNASFYNMTTGQPSGVTYLDGVQIGESASYAQFFAILKDGTAIIDYTKNLASYQGNIQQAAAGSQMLVFGGKDVTKTISGSYNVDRHSRTCIGVTADGKVVVMSLDGRQEPFSCGGTMHELAQIMLEAGCVSAINLDGGGSTTFAARQEGENEVTIVNRPSDGSERAISSGIIIASLAPPSNVFERATLEAEKDFVTPGSAVKVTAKGVSPAGTAAEIPDDIGWQLADSSMGSVENGVFKSNGTVGKAVVQMVYNGAVVGETTINVVIPDKIEFNSQTITVPYGKTVSMSLSATYSLNDVVLKDSDITFKLENTAVGTFDGFKFTACEENASITGSAVTAVFAYDASITCSATIALGKGSEILQDFEDQNPIDNYVIKTTYPQYGPMGSTLDKNGNYYYNGQNEIGSIELVTAENGQVKNGSAALAVTCDYTKPYETGYLGLDLIGLNLTVDASAQSFGFWMYIPENEDIVGAKIRPIGRSKSSATNNVTKYIIQEGQSLLMEDNGWHYFSVDLSAYNEPVTFSAIQFYVTDRDFASNNYKFAENSSITGKFTFYIDDFTVDYSSAVDDREAPVYEYVRASYGGLSDAVNLAGQTINSNVVSVTAKVADDTTKANYTGIDVSTAKAYIDGVELTSGYSCTTAGIFTIDDVALADGVHTFTFEICDRMGNKSSIKRQINVAANSGLSNVTFVAENEKLGKLPIGSIYWMNLKASDIEKIDNIEAVINLNSVSNWELEGMEVAKGFKAEYSIDDITNNATINFTKTGNVDATGEAIVARIPIRTWISRITECTGYEASTPSALWKRKIIWPYDIKVNVDLGKVQFVDGTSSTFSSKKYAVDTELFGNFAELNAAGEYSNKTSWHIHTAKAVADKTATCTENGYTGRTYCDVCSSVVDWGTIIPATGHKFGIIDGVAKCECGELYTQNYTGLFHDEINGVYRYLRLGNLSTGWYMIDDEWYYFDPATKTAATGEFTYNGITYEFEETGRLTTGVWVTDDIGSRYYYGPDYYRSASSVSDASWFTINGNTYCIDHDGYRYEGLRYVNESNSKKYLWFDFGDDGIAVAVTGTGILEYKGNLYYHENGVSTASTPGLVEVDGNYYYPGLIGKLLTGYIEVTFGNGIVPNMVWYEFDNEGKMVLKNGFVTENGSLFYYGDDGFKVAGTGLTEIDGSYYYISTYGELATGKYYIEDGKGIVADNSTYTFDETGKLITDEIREIGGELYYYKNGVLQKNLGLVEINGDYYYVRTYGQLAVGSYVVKNGNGIIADGTTRTFDENGKMLEEEVKDIHEIRKIGDDLYYFINDVLQKNLGLVEINGDYYYVRTYGILAVGDYVVKNGNGIVEDGTLRTFDENGKMLEEEIEDVHEIRKIGDDLYYFLNGELQKNLGLVEINGDYYYVRTYGILAVGNYVVKDGKGVVADGTTCNFGTDGKLIVE